MSENYAIKMEISNEIAKDKNASRFHGNAYLPASLANDDLLMENYYLFARIRLADIAEIDTEGLLPHEGYLYFFIDVSEIETDYHEYKPALVEYSAEEPNTVIEYGVSSENGYLIKFSKVASDEDCTRLFGVESENLSNPVFMQYKVSDFKEYNKEAIFPGAKYIYFYEWKDSKHSDEFKLWYYVDYKGILLANGRKPDEPREKYEFTPRSERNFYYDWSSWLKYIPEDSVELEYENGDKYTGQMKDGKRHGIGHMDYSNGGEYIGEWKDDKRSGRGTYYKSYYTYEGEWYDDKKHGHGREENKTEEGCHRALVSAAYIGDFKNDMRYGEGMILEDEFDGYFTTGRKKVTKGIFENGNMVKSEMTELPDGTICETSGEGEALIAHYTMPDGTTFDCRFDKYGHIDFDTIESELTKEMPLVRIYWKKTEFMYSNSFSGFFWAEEAEYPFSEMICFSGSTVVPDKALEITKVTKDSISVYVSGVFFSDNKGTEQTILRGEKKVFEDRRKGTATIEDDDYDYEILDLLEIECR